MTLPIRLLLRITVAGVLVFSPATLLHAQNFWINSGTGNWFGNTNWSQGRPPVFNEGTVIESGNVILNSAGATAGQITLGGSFLTATMTISAGGTLSVNNGSFITIGQNGTGTLNINGGLLDYSGNNSQILLGNGQGKGTLNVYSGTLKTDNLLIGRNSSSVTLSGGSTEVLNLRVGVSAQSISSMLVNGGNLATDKSTVGFQSVFSTATISSGTWSSNANTDDSFTIGHLSGSGTVKISKSGYVRVGSTGTAAVVMGYTTSSTNNRLIIGDNTAFTGTLQAGGITTRQGNGTVTFSQTNEYVFSAIMSGQLSLDQNGSGTTVLTRTNTYARGTTVTRGTLLVNGISSTGTGAVVVKDDGVLGGTGSITGNVTVEAGGRLAAGSNTLTLNGGLDLKEDSELFFRLGASSDLITEAGTLVLAEGVHLIISEQAGFDVGEYTLITFSGGLTDNSANFSDWTIAGLSPGYEGEFVFDSSSLVLVVSAVPEPGSLSLAALGLVSLLVRRRSRPRLGGS